MLNTPAKAAAATSSHTRLIEVLDMLVQRVGGEAWGVRELAGETGESRSTVNRILASLVERGFATEAGAGKYALGPRLRILTQALFERSVLIGQSQSALDSLASAAQRTALLSIYDPHAAGYFVAACSEAPTPLSFRPEPGVTFPLKFGDIGRKFSELSPSPASESVLASAFGQLSEAEFPKALSIAPQALGNGLLVALSLHSLGDLNSDSGFSSQAQVATAMGELAAAVNACSPRQPTLPADDDKSTSARLERLIQLACTAPNGLQVTAQFNGALLCNGATAKKILTSAAETGLVNLLGDTLHPGPLLYRWAARINTHAPQLADLCRAILHDLAQETGETVALLDYQATTGTAQFVEVTQGWRPIQYKLHTHVDVSLYAGAAGKAVLAHLERSVADSLELTPFTEATITCHQALTQDLEQICCRGWSTGEGERVPGAYGVAVPFFVDGQVRGSISATIPQYRKGDCDLPNLVARMQQASMRIAKLLSLG